MINNLLITLLSLFIGTAQEYSAIYGEIKGGNKCKETSEVVFLHNSSGCQYYSEIDQNGTFHISKMRCGGYSVFVTLNDVKYAPFSVELSPKDNFITFIENKAKKKILAYLVL